jgi:asparagine synthase (glutamine-hydrolysing)
MAAVPPSASKKGLLNKAKRFVEGAALPEALRHVRWMVFLSEGQKSRLYAPALREQLKGHCSLEAIEDHFRQAGPFDGLAQQQYVDIKSYLADDILVKVDRMTMACSLEARVPLLDHRIVELALNLPAAMKLDRGRTKVILRQAMAGRLPETTLRKAKEGFSMPIKHWLNGPLRGLTHELLAPERINNRGYFCAPYIASLIAEHQQGAANRSHQLWALMVFELWSRRLDSVKPG